MQYFFICVTILIISLLLLHHNSNILNIIKMYGRTNRIINVLIKGGLGNRLMSFSSIIILSIYFKSKPYCIILYIK